MIIDPTLVGCRVLVAEDEMLISMLMEDFLHDHGCHVVGPCASLNSALEAARASQFDIALLDVNLQGGKIYPVAKLLEERRMPFLIMGSLQESDRHVR